MARQRIVKKPTKNSNAKHSKKSITAVSPPRGRSGQRPATAARMFRPKSHSGSHTNKRPKSHSGRRNPESILLKQRSETVKAEQVFLQIIKSERATLAELTLRASLQDDRIKELELELARRPKQLQPQQLCKCSCSAKLDYYKQRVLELSDLHDWKRSAQSANVAVNASCVRRFNILHDLA